MINFYKLLNKPFLTKDFLDRVDYQSVDQFSLILRENSYISPNSLLDAILLLDKGEFGILEMIINYNCFFSKEDIITLIPAERKIRNIRRNSFLFEKLYNFDNLEFFLLNRYSFSKEAMSEYLVSRDLSILIIHLNKQQQYNLSRDY